MVIFYKKWKKYNEFQLTKNKMDLNIRKMTNHPPSPVLRDTSFLHSFVHGVVYLVLCLSVICLVTSRDLSIVDYLLSKAVFVIFCGVGACGVAPAI